jgi:small subunit ribosomal protein S4
VVYRLGFALSRPQARQVVRHGHIEVNGSKVDIPSYLVKPGDVVAIRPGSRKAGMIQDNAVDLEHRAVPDWLSRDERSLSGRVLSMPRREDIDVAIDEQLIVEYYSR